MAEEHALVVGVGRFVSTVPADEEPSADTEAYPNLDFVYDVVPDINRALSRAPFSYEVHPALDPDREEVGDHVTRALDDEYMIVWAVSHGQTSRDDPGVHLVPHCCRFGTATDIAAWVGAAQMRGKPMLFLLDLCRSGRMARDPRLLRLAGSKDTKAWVIAASGGEENAFDGVFSRAAVQVLEQAARDGLGTDPSRRYISFRQVARRISIEVVRASGSRQTVHASVLDASLAEPELPFFPNPRYIDSPRLHLLTPVEESLRAILTELGQRRGMGVSDPGRDAVHFAERAGLHFCGRREQLRRLVPWFEGPGATQDRGVHLVTGRPGTGKSALIGALVCAAHPELAKAAPQIRATLQAHGAQCCPSLNNALAAVHARGRSTEEMMGSLGQQLVLAQPPDGWTPGTLIEHIGGLPTAPVIVIDALDEAVDPGGTTDSLLMPMAETCRSQGGPVCRLIVAARPWEQFKHLRAVAEENDTLLDLDHIPAAQQHQDLVDYVTACLADTQDYGSAQQRETRQALASAVADRLCHPSEGTAEWGAFLVATIFLDYVGSVEPATTVAEAQHLAARVPLTLPAVLDLDLGNRPNGGPLRAVLAALAHAEGEGMPADLIAQVAAAFDLSVDQVQLEELLDDGRFYVRTGIDTDGTVLYRLFHQGLADHLRQHPHSGSQETA